VFDLCAWPESRIFNFQKAYSVLDELIIAGELQESSKKSVLRVVSEASERGNPSSLPSIVKVSYASCDWYPLSLQVTQSDSIEDQENSEDTLARLGSRSGTSSPTSSP
jgi:AP-1 complex subunit sigma 1/2